MHAHEPPVVIDGPATALRPHRNATLLAARSTLIDINALGSAIRKHLGVVPTSIRFVNAGTTAIVYDVATRQRPLLAKIWLFQDTKSPLSEAAFVHSIYANCDRNGQRICLLDASADFIPAMFLVRTFVPGRVLSDYLTSLPVPEHQNVFRSAAQYLAALHARSPRGTGFGTIDRHAAMSLLRHRNAPSSYTGRPFDSQIVSRTSTRIKSLTSGVPVDTQTAWLTDLEQLHQLAKAPTILTHGDPSCANFIYDDSRCRGLIDGGAILGVPESDLATLCVFACYAARQRFNHSHDVAATILHDYEQVASVTVNRALVRSFMVIRTLKWIDSQAALGADVAVDLPLHIHHNIRCLPS